LSTIPGKNALFHFTHLYHRRFEAESAWIQLNSIILNIVRSIPVIKILREFVQELDPHTNLTKCGNHLSYGPIPFVGIDLYF
jgi:hypothetical protein